MFRKYEKTYRLALPEFIVKGKLLLDHNQVKDLFAGMVTIEEKMDGANIGIIRHKTGFHLQKRGSLVSTSEHAQFQFFHNWANVQNYDKLMALPKKYIVYGELMYALHTIYYDQLPDFVLVFDVWNGERYLNRFERDKFCDKYSFHQVPLLFTDFYNPVDVQHLVPKKSAYGSTAEGIVIKRYKKNGNYCKAKLVWPRFQKEMEESDHWMHKQLRRNKLGVTND